MNRIPKKVYVISYIIIMLTIVMMVTASAIDYWSKIQWKHYYNDGKDFSAGWVDADGKKIDLENLQNVGSASDGDETSIYNKLPDNLDTTECLCFYSAHIYFDIFIDGTKIYDVVVPDTVFLTDGSGGKWHIVKLGKEYAGKTVELKYTCPYYELRQGIVDMQLNNDGDMILCIIADSSVAFITSLLLLVTGIFFVIFDIIINLSAKNNRELLFLGLIAISIATWCLSETHIISLFTNDGRTMHLLSLTTLMTFPLPVALYVGSAFSIRKNYPMHIICLFSIGQFIVSFILNVTDIADYKHTLIVTHSMLIVIMAYIIISISRYLFVERKKHLNKISMILQIFGLIFFAAMATVDLYRYYNASARDSAEFSRIGLLGFVLCYGIASIDKTIRKTKSAARSELIEKLAYIDGLTEVGNRTSFQENMEKLQNDINDNTCKNAAVIMFDVNNLKLVNDTLGHQMGDKMIMDSANIIKSAFEKFGGDTFRIGGDEFAVIISGDSTDSNVENGIECFLQLMDDYNNHDKDFSLIIAHGFAKISNTKHNIYDVQRSADMLMYEKKRQLKMENEPVFKTASHN